MYTHRLDAVLKALIPLPSAFLQTLSHHAVRQALDSDTTLNQFAAYLSQSASSNLRQLTVYIAHIKEIWQDMVALGLFDPELWDTIDFAWEVALRALYSTAKSN
ncbi:hypothetical protein BDQ17DRAFT_1344791 [Cyathus striatus]|nr:hypothetical protein BDQ17DRAFT_1344791 [Cyathus striatus]